MYAAYVARRFGVMLLVIVLAVTINFALPRRKATANLSYSRGPFTGFLQLRYIGPGVYDTQNGIGNNNWIVADNSIGSIAYFDTRLAWKVEISDSTVELYASGTNLMDRDPPIIPVYSAAVAAPALAFLRRIACTPHIPVPGVRHAGLRLVGT